LAEVLTTIGIAGLLASLMIPAVQHVREQSRLIACRDRLRQLSMSCQTHETIAQVFPATSTFWGETVGGRPVLHQAISTHRHLLATLDSTMFLKVDFEDPTPPTVDAGGPPFMQSARNRELLQHRVPMFLCPSDLSLPGATNYRCNLGVGVQALPQRPVAGMGAITPGGAFVNGRGVHADEFTDGLSHTAMWSERVLGDGNPSVYSPFQDRYAPATTPITTSEEALDTCRRYAIAAPESHDSFMGFNWMLGGWVHTWYQHLATPNSKIPDCSHGDNVFQVDGGRGLYLARSWHHGGVNVAFSDGSARFTTDSIDARVWRAWGTRNGGELTESDVMPP
jgi:hypothetical protein